jgi:anti-sigma B factor antagonist
METPPDFDIETRREEAALIVAARGEIDMATAGQVEAALRDGGAKHEVVVLDLRGVTFLDTSGIRLVVSEQRRAEEAGHRFAVVRGPRPVQRIFSISGLDDEPDLLLDDPAEILGG